MESIRGGNRPNMVPDFCEAVLISSDAKSLEEAAGKLAAFAGQTDYKMTSEMDNGKLSIKSYGVSAHGSTPEKGQNAIAQMLEFLNGISLEGEG